MRTHNTLYQGETPKSRRTTSIPTSFVRDSYNSVRIGEFDVSHQTYGTNYAANTIFSGVVRPCGLTQVTVVVQSRSA